MDKKEFYRQLMESYTVDTERVKRNAKRKSRNVKSTALIIRNWTAAAAACGAVTAAAVAVVSLGSVPHLDNTTGYDIIEDGAARVAAAEEQFEVYALNNDEEYFDLFVSFRKPIKRSEITMAFSVIEDYNDISIVLFYTSEGEYYASTPELDEGMQFLGAKISAPASILGEIKMLKEVALVEYASEDITDDSFKPFNNKPEDIITTLAEPAGETVQISVPEVTTLPPVSAETAETPAETSVSEETAATDVTGEATTAPEETSEAVPVTEETTAAESADTAQPEYVTLTVPLTGVKTVNFINDKCFVATTADSIRLLSCEGGEVKIKTTYYASGAKISYCSYDGTRMFIIARDGNNSTRLYYADGRCDADGESALLCEVEISGITSGGAELSSVSCSSDGKIILMKTVSLDKTVIYYGERSDGAITLANKEYTNPASVLAYSDGVVYTAVTDSKENTVKIYGVNINGGTETELASYSGTLKINRNSAVSMALLTVTNGESETNILLGKGALIPVETNQAVFAGAKDDLVMIGDKYFTVNGGELSETSAEEAEQYFMPADGSGYEINENGEASVIVRKD